MAKAKSTKSVKITTSILCIIAIIIGFLAGGFVYLYLNQEESDVLLVEILKHIF